MSRKNSVLAETRLVGQSLTNLPSESLSQLATTPDLLRFLNKQKDFMTLVSWCWRARIRGEDDPLLPIVEAGEMDKVLYQGFWLYTNKLFALWALTQQCFQFIKRKALRKKLHFPFTSACELFLHLVETKLEEDFLERLGYKEVSQEKIGEHAKLSEKLIEIDLPPKEYARWKYLGHALKPKLQIKKDGVHWGRFCFEVFDELAKTDLLIDSELDNFAQITKALYSLQYTMSQKRYSKTWDPLFSHFWRDGYMFY